MSEISCERLIDDDVATVYRAKLAVLRLLQTNLSSREREARLLLGVGWRERAVAPWTAPGLLAATRPAP
ncbi:MAG: hypothetical protein ACXVII_32090 [Solirubrobacteraceae bacterium]